MTIPAWHMDTTVFGNPDWGISQQPSDHQFMRFPGDRGLGQYREQNERAPHQVSLAWDMSDDVFSQFTEAWNSAAFLCWGANWFTADLPLMHSQFDQQVDYLTNHLVKIKQRFALTVGANSTGNDFGMRWDTTHATGKVKPANFAGSYVRRLSVRFDTGLFAFETANLTKVPNNDTVTAYLNVPGEEEIGHVLNATSTRFQASIVEDQPSIETYLKGNVGETIPIDIEFLTTPFQRYRCHFREPYRAEVIGVGHWRVSASIEVDVTPEFDTTAVTL